MAGPIATSLFANRATARAPMLVSLRLSFEHNCVKKLLRLDRRADLGTRLRGELFVAVLGASSYHDAEALLPSAHSLGERATPRLSSSLPG